MLPCFVYAILIFLPAGVHCGVVYLGKGDFALLGGCGNVLIFRLKFTQAVASADFDGNFPINGAHLAELGFQGTAVAGLDADAACGRMGED